MSYLLTEIALEMLGYKFYNIDGVYNSTSFQNSNPNEGSINESSLENLLQLNEVATVSSTTNIENPSAPKSLTDLQLNLHLYNQTKVKGATRTSLPKLLEREYERVQEQAIRNKAFNLDLNVDTIAKIEQGKITATQLLQPFVNNEKEVLKTEIQALHHFRIIVEKDLIAANPSNFKVYKRFFKNNEITK